MISIFVTIQIKDGFVEQFKEASLGDSQGSVRDEPGCFRFDILQNSEDSNKFLISNVLRSCTLFSFNNIPFQINKSSNVPLNITHIPAT